MIDALPRRAVLAGVLAMSACTRAGAGLAVTRLRFDDLPGWADGAPPDLWPRPRRPAPAEPALLGPAWQPPAWLADWPGVATPVLIGDPAAGLMTGYYEPVLQAAPTRGGVYQTPIHALPPEPERFLPRAQIVAGGLAGFELYWLADPVEAFFLQIQGSGRLRLPGGRLVRVGYAGQNGQPYVAIGRILVAEHGFDPAEVTAQSIKDWLRADPLRGAALMDRNPSYVFFAERPEPDLPWRSDPATVAALGFDPGPGPIGTAATPLTPLRSLAVDAAFYPMGLPLWVETVTPLGPLARLMVAEDTGGAIRGPQRGDLFFGTGDAAGHAAGAMRAPGRIVALIPRAVAAALPDRLPDPGAALGA